MKFYNIAKGIDDEEDPQNQNISNTKGEHTMLGLELETKDY